MTKPYKLSDNKWIKQTFYSQGKHSPVNIGDIIANFTAQDSVNKIDSRVFNGLAKKELKNILLKSDFDTEKAKAGKILSFFGEVAVALIIIDGEPIIKFFRVKNFESSGVELTSILVEGESNYSDSQTGFSAPILYRWFIDRNQNSKTFGRVIRDTVYYDEVSRTTKIVPEAKQYVYDKRITKIPCQIIRNTPDATPDLIIAAEILLELNVLGSEIGQEWEFIKTQLNNVSALMGSGKKGSTREIEILNGSRIADSTSPNSKFAASFTPVISGSASLQQLLQTITWFEDRAMKYAFGGRDASGSGTNKHNAEISLFNQAQSEMVQVKIEQRQRDYNRFFNTIVKMFISFVGDVNIKIDSTEFEKGKIEGLKQAQAQRILYEQQAAAQGANADRADAERALKEAQTRKVESDIANANSQNETVDETQNEE